MSPLLLKIGKKNFTQDEIELYIYAFLLKVMVDIQREQSLEDLGLLRDKETHFLLIQATRHFKSLAMYELRGIYRCI